MIQITGKQILAALLIKFIGFMQQKTMVISRDPVGIDLQVWVNQRPARWRQVVLGDGHVYGLRIVLKYFFQIPAAINKAVGIRWDGSRADLHKVFIIEQTDDG